MLFFKLFPHYIFIDQSMYKLLKRIQYPCSSVLFSSLSALVKVYMSVVVSDVTLVDNGMGIMPLIYEPPSSSHEYSNKTILIQVKKLKIQYLWTIINIFPIYAIKTGSHNLNVFKDCLIVGNSPNFNCSDTVRTDDVNIGSSIGHRAPRPLNGTLPLFLCAISQSQF